MGGRGLRPRRRRRRGDRVHSDGRVDETGERQLSEVGARAGEVVQRAQRHAGRLGCAGANRQVFELGPRTSEGGDVRVVDRHDVVETREDEGAQVAEGKDGREEVTEGGEVVAGQLSHREQRQVEGAHAAGGHGSVKCTEQHHDVRRSEIYLVQGGYVDARLLQSVESGASEEAGDTEHSSSHSHHAQVANGNSRAGRNPGAHNVVYTKEGQVRLRDNGFEGFRPRDSRYADVGEPIEAEQLLDERWANVIEVNAFQNRGRFAQSAQQIRAQYLPKICGEPGMAKCRSEKWNEGAISQRVANLPPYGPQKREDCPPVIFHDDSLYKKAICIFHRWQGVRVMANSTHMCGMV